MFDRCYANKTENQLGLVHNQHICIIALTSYRYISQYSVIKIKFLVKSLVAQQQTYVIDVYGNVEVFISNGPKARLKWH